MNATAAIPESPKVGERGRREAMGQQLAVALGVQQDPFRAPRSFFFDGAQRRHVLESLRHLAAFGDLVLVLSGEVGSGKTTLLQELLRIEKDQLRPLTLTAEDVANARDLATALVRKADLHRIDGEPPVKAIARFMTNSGSTPKSRVVVVVDDAERVPLVVLEFLLAQFVKANRVESPVLLLSGTSELIQKVRLIHAEIHQLGWLHQLQLKSLSVDESLSYVQARINAVGGAVPDVMASRIEKLVQMGKGNFGRINRMAPGVLLDRFSEVPERTSRRAMPYVLSAAVAAGLLVTSFFLVQSWREPDGPSLVDAVPRVEIHVPPILDVEPVQPASIEPSPFKDDRPAAVLPESKPAVEISESTESEVVQSEPKPVVLVAEAAPVAVDVPAAAIVVADKAAVASVEAPASPEKTVPPGSVASMPERQSEAVPALDVPSQLVEPVVEKPKPVSVKAASQTDGQWLASRSASHLTLQLMGSSTRDGARAFAKQYAGKVPVRVIDSTLKGKPWYVVVAGDYADRPAAQRAIASLPDVLRKQNPWIRSFKGLQE